MRSHTVVLALLAVLCSPLAQAADWLIDVRTPQEVAQGKVDGAINIEYQDIVAGVRLLDVQQDDTIYLYCRSGRRAGAALESLQAAGFPKVINLGSQQQATAWQHDRTQPPTLAHVH